MKKILIILLFLFSIGNTFAQKIELFPENKSVILCFDRINRKVYLRNLTEEDISHIKIDTNKSNYGDFNYKNDIYIHLDERPTVEYYENKIEVHLDTIFINDQGIGLHNDVQLLKDDHFLLDNLTR